ncbi:MAG: ABC transporter permease [Phycisphaerales bacterium JB043]
MRRVLATAIREFKATAFTKAFIIGTFFVPLIIWVVLIGAGMAGLFDDKTEPVIGTVAVQDLTEGDAVSAELARYLDPAEQEARRERQIEQMRARQEALGLPTSEMANSFVLSQFGLPEGSDMSIELLPDEDSWEDIAGRVGAGDFIAAVRVDAESLTSPGEFDMSVGQSVKRQVSEEIESGVRESVVRVRYAQAGLEYDEVVPLNRRPRASVQTVTESGAPVEAGNRAQQIIPIAMMVLLSISIFTGASYLLMSTVEEKNSRVMEVLLSAISPLELLWGKVLGQGAVGLLILIVYGALGAVVGQRFDILELISPYMLTLSVVYFLIGYFTIAAIMAAIGSAVNEIREAQALQTPVIGVLVLGIYLALFAGMQDTDSILTKVMSFIPGLSAFVMPMRLGNTASPPPFWEVGISVALGIAGVIVCVWAAAKIFRIGVLMYGKPPTFKGMLAWIQAQ